MLGIAVIIVKLGKAFLFFLAVASEKLMLVGDKHVSNDNYDTYIYTLKSWTKI